MRRLLSESKKSSLRTDFVYALSLVILGTSALIMLVDYNLVYTQNTQTLVREAEDTMAKSAETLRQPLWLYDVDFVKRFSNILIGDHNILQVTIYDERNKILVNHEDPALQRVGKEHMWTLERDIVVDWMHVGRLVLTFTNEDIQRLTRTMMFTDMFTMFSAMICILCMAWLLISRQMLIPLDMMKNAFQMISAGNYSRRVTLPKENELSEIANEFNKMVDQVELRENEIRESESNYRTLVESSTDIIFRTDIRGHLIFMNQNFAHWTEYTIENFIGRPFVSMFPKRFSATSLQRFQAGLSGEHIELYEIEIACKNGATVPMELNLIIQKDMDDTPIGAIGIARDITERHRNEHELRKYEQMIGSSTDYMWLIDRDFTVNAVNEAVLSLYGCSREKLIGSHFCPVVGEEVFESTFQPHIEACLAGGTAKHKAWVDSPDRGLRYLDISFYPNVELDKSVSGVVINERDITEQKELETKLQQAQKMEAIGTLAGGIAHDFNNILGGIIGYAEMIEMFDVADNTSLGSRVEHILKGASRARELVEQILTFSRHADQQSTPLSLSPLVRETLKFLRATIPSTIEIEEEILSPDCVIMGNATQVHQVLMNICTNAAYAMQDDGGIMRVKLCEEALDTVTAKQYSGITAGKYVRLSIADTGAGIPPQIAERIFEPFFTTKKVGDGTGMGLAVVHGIVQTLGGAVSFTSTEGKGSIFTILLPCCEQNVIEEERGGFCAVPLGKGRILFVDDEEDLVSLSSEMLRHFGYEVVAESQSEKARDLFLADPDSFDLVITDQTMPVLTGLDLAEEILARRPDLPIILCTGYSTPALEKRVPESGIRYFVRKPVGARQLADLVSDALTSTETA